MSLDKALAAQRIRTRLEKRIAGILGCQTSDLPYSKIGSLIHLCFLLDGTDETIGGFHSSFSAVLDLIGTDLTWDTAPKRGAEEKTPEEVIN